MLKGQGCGRSVQRTTPQVVDRSHQLSARHLYKPCRVSCGAEPAQRANLNSAIAALALPALGTELIDPLLSICDTAFVGRIGAEQLAGVGIASSVFTYTFLFFNFLSTASAPLVARALARNDDADARQTVESALSLALVLGLACCALLELNAGGAVRLMAGGGSGALQGPTDIAEQYLRVRALGIPFSLVTTALGGAFRGMLDTRTPLTVAAAANALNLALDPVLIFGLGPVPAFAAPGAAAATVVAEAVAAAALLRRLSTTRLWPRWLGLPKWGQVHEFAEASGAVLTRTAALQSTLLLATATVARHAAVGGAAEVAAHQVTLQTWFFLSYLMDALAVAASGLVADSLGRQDSVQARRAAERCVTIGGVVAVALFALLTSQPGTVAALFTDDREVQSATIGALGIVAAMQPLNAIVFVGDGVFQGAADFQYLAVGMLAACGLSAGAMLTGHGSLPEVWQALMGLQAARAVAISLRYANVVPFFGGSPLEAAAEEA